MKSKRTDVGGSPTVQPLTARNAEGYPYERLPAVQREIEAMVGLESEVLLASASGLSEETLVYLIRERRRVQDWSVAERLAAILLDRCRRILLGTLGSLPQDVRDEAIATVLQQLFERIVTLDNDRGDFYQVRFGSALKRLGTTAFRQCVLTIAQHKRTEHDADAEWADSRNAPFDPHQWPEDGLDFTDVRSARAAIKDERHRMAFELHATDEMPIESDDPKTATISRYFKVSPRTITNWLKQAEADLAQWRRGKS